MNDQEFDVMDELYFVQSFAEVQEETGLDKKALKEVLQKLLEKGWVRCMTGRTEELPAEELNFSRKYDQYFYLATKAGLLAHNTR